MSEQPLHVDDLREHLESESGPRYWRSLEEAAATDAFQESLHDEFMKGASEWNEDPEGRRNFLKVVGASMAVAGLAGCTVVSDERIVPYVQQPESIVPGQPNYYATSFLLGGYAMGVLAESHEGRPTKLEGNPAHPASLGATSRLMQASIMNLYDPDRSQTTLHQGKASTWEDFVAAASSARARWQRTGGRGLRLLTGTVTSPTLAAQLRALLQEFPQARWHVHDPTASGAKRGGQRSGQSSVPGGQNSGKQGSQRGGGGRTQPLYHFDKADVVFSLEGDQFLYGPGSVRYAHDFAEARRVRSGGEAEMSRLYATASTPTLMSAQADHRLPLPPARLKQFAQAVAGRLGASGGTSQSASGRPSTGRTRRRAGGWKKHERKWLDAVVSDLQGAGSKALVVAGRTQPPQVHALAKQMNQSLGAAGTTVEYIPSPEEQPTGPEASLRALTRDMKAGDVDALVILGGNPAYSAPADVPFANHLSEVPFSVHQGTFNDATSERCQWHVPATHYLEAWGDARAFDGTASIVQPLIRPLYDACHSAHQVTAALQGAPGQTGYDLVRRYWRQASGSSGGQGGFELFWEKALYHGVIPGTGHLPLPTQPKKEQRLTESEREHGGPQKTKGGPPQQQPPGSPADTTAASGMAAPAPDTTAAPGMAAPSAASGAAASVGQGPRLLKLGPERQSGGSTGQSASPSGDTTGAGADTTSAADTSAADTTDAYGRFANRPNDTAAADTTDEPKTQNPKPKTDTLELIFRPDPSVWDGTFANNTWMMELPKPFTKITWGNAALISPSTAEQLGVEVGRISNDPQDVLELQYRGRTLKAPAWVVPGHADGCVTLRLGYGHTAPGFVGGEGTEATAYRVHEQDQMEQVEGDDVGVNAYRLRTADAPWGGPGLSLKNTGDTEVVVSTQAHWSMEGRRLVRAGTLEEFRKNPGYPTEDEPDELPTLYPEYDYDGGGDGPYEDEDAPPFYLDRSRDEYDHNYKWGMVIDQNVCTGCNACVVACQSENNIPVVGKKQVRIGREMQWLRIDRYYEGTLDDPETHFQPLPCMNCEKAPCELVCPVGATVHDAEGLNVMVYNRCIGTRYCSNNCPYKVRRFNFLQWSDWKTEVRALQRNPDVTVRSRGVMEKCTYCAQRISSARIEAKTENREIRDGEVMTACQQACPTQAISFGDLNDEDAQVTQWEEQPHNYGLLAELGTQPRTTYLTHLSNPKKELKEKNVPDQIRKLGLHVPKMEKS